VSEAEKPVFVRGRVPESMKARFKATCALRGRDLGDVLQELIEKWLEEHETASQIKKTSGISQNLVETYRRNVFI
jgi:hypothetical protein